jgi:hypothetical protein
LFIEFWIENHINIARNKRVVLQSTSRFLDDNDSHRKHFIRFHLSGPLSNTTSDKIFSHSTLLFLIQPKKFALAKVIPKAKIGKTKMTKKEFEMMTMTMTMK